MSEVSSGVRSGERSVGQDSKLGYVASLTGLRGVAAVWVLAYHVMSVAVSCDRIEPVFLARTGWAGVDLFFILSGFVIAEAHGEALQRFGWRRTLAYLKIRCWRIYPVSSAALVGVVLLVGIDHRFALWFAHKAAGNLTPQAFVATLLLATQLLPIHGDWNQPVWSLSVEMVGYAGFPLLAVILARASSATLLVAASVLTLLVMIDAEIALGSFGENSLAAPATLVRLAGCFVAGSCLHRAAVLCGDAWRRSAPILAILCVALVLVLATLPFGGSLMCLPFAMLILALGVGRGLVDTGLRTRPVQLLGRISFPLYVLHIMPLLQFNLHLGRVEQTSNGVYVVALAGFLLALTTAAWLCHRGVELPAARWARRRSDGLRHAETRDRPRSAPPLRSAAPRLEAGA